MKQLALGLVAVGLITSGCCCNRAGTGAIVGGLLGGGVGALVASNAAAGAAIGVAAGAATGAIIGAAMDASDRYRCECCCPQTLARIDNNERLNVGDVKAMAKAGLKEEVIIGQIQNTKSSFHLNSAQIAELKDAGVSQGTINYMVQTGR